MRVVKHVSLISATKVLAEITKLARKKRTKQELWCDCWYNCREQGYYLTNSDSRKFCCFAECRGSDQIVVFYGPKENFDTITHQPNVWDGKYFITVQDAAKWIVRYLTIE